MCLFLRVMAAPPIFTPNLGKKTYGHYTSTYGINQEDFASAFFIPCPDHLP